MGDSVFHDYNWLYEAINIFGRQSFVYSLDYIFEGSDLYLVNKKSKEKKAIQNLPFFTNNYDINNLFGELQFNSINSDGTRLPDNRILRLLNENIYMPIILSCGYMSVEDMELCLKQNIDGIAVASLIHYKKSDIYKIKRELNEKSERIRI